MKKQSFLNSIFRLLRFVLIVFVGYIVYQALFSEILTKRIHIFTYIFFWLFSSYIILPFVNKLLTGHYLPNYFIGRSRTGDGLLGDPINLAFIGDENELKQLFLDSGWTIAEPLTLRSSIHMVVASVFARSYPSAPVSSLFLFNKKQDLAFEKEIENNPRRRHHVRFWKTPEKWYLPGGRKADWLGAATYDKKVGFSIFTGQFTHKINSDIDQERDFVLASIKESAHKIEVEMVEHFTTSYHGRNGGGDRIFTDGSLPFIQVTKSK